MKILIVSSQEPAEAFLSLARGLQPQILFHEDTRTSRDAAMAATQVFRGLSQVPLVRDTEADPSTAALLLGGIARGLARGARSVIFVLDAASVCDLVGKLEPVCAKPAAAPTAIGPFCALSTYERLEKGLGL